MGTTTTTGTSGRRQRGLIEGIGHLHRTAKPELARVVLTATASGMAVMLGLWLLLWFDRSGGLEVIRLSLGVQGQTPVDVPESDLLGLGVSKQAVQPVAGADMLDELERRLRRFARSEPVVLYLVGTGIAQDGEAYLIRPNERTLAPLDDILREPDARKQREALLARGIVPLSAILDRLSQPDQLTRPKLLILEVTPFQVEADRGVFVNGFLEALADQFAESVPPNLAVLVDAGPGQVALRSEPDGGASVFAHFMRRGLAGEAATWDPDGSGQVRLYGLAGYIRHHVSEWTRRRLGREQIPVLLTSDDQVRNILLPPIPPFEVDELESESEPNGSRSTASSETPEPDAAASKGDPASTSSEAPGASKTEGASKDGQAAPVVSEAERVTALVDRAWRRRDELEQLRPWRDAPLAWRSYLDDLLMADRLLRLGRLEEAEGRLASIAQAETDLIEPAMRRLDWEYPSIAMGRRWIGDDAPSNRDARGLANPSTSEDPSEDDEADTQPADDLLRAWLAQLADRRDELTRDEQALQDGVNEVVGDIVQIDRVVRNVIQGAGSAGGAPVNNATNGLVDPTDANASGDGSDDSDSALNSATNTPAAANVSGDSPASQLGGGILQVPEDPRSAVKDLLASDRGRVSPPRLSEAQLLAWAYRIEQFGSASGPELPRDFNEFRSQAFQRAVEHRRLAERATAPDPRAFDHVRPTVLHGDRLRRAAEDRLFDLDFGEDDQQEVDGILQDGDRIYREAIAQADLIERAHDIVEELAVHLPYLGRWYARQAVQSETQRKAFDNLIGQLAVLIDLLNGRRDETLKTDAVEASLIDLNAALSQVRDDLDYAIRQTVNANTPNWSDLDDLLAVPTISAVDRARLRQRLRDVPRLPSFDQPMTDQAEPSRSVADPEQIATGASAKTLQFLLNVAEMEATLAQLAWGPNQPGADDLDAMLKMVEEEPLPSVNDPEQARAWLDRFGQFVRAHRTALVRARESTPNRSADDRTAQQLADNARVARMLRPADAQAASRSIREAVSRRQSFDAARLLAFHADRAFRDDLVSDHAQTIAAAARAIASRDLGGIPVVALEQIEQRIDRRRRQSPRIRLALGEEDSAVLGDRDLQTDIRLVAKVENLDLVAEPVGSTASSELTGRVAILTPVPDQDDRLELGLPGGDFARFVRSDGPRMSRTSLLELVSDDRGRPFQIRRTLYRAVEDRPLVEPVAFYRGRLFPSRIPVAVKPFNDPITVTLQTAYERGQRFRPTRVRDQFDEHPRAGFFYPGAGISYLVNLINRDEERTYRARVELTYEGPIQGKGLFGPDRFFPPNSNPELGDVDIPPGGTVTIDEEIMGVGSYNIFPGQVGFIDVNVNDRDVGAGAGDQVGLGPRSTRFQFACLDPKKTIKVQVLTEVDRRNPDAEAIVILALRGNDGVTDSIDIDMSIAGTTRTVTVNRNQLCHAFQIVPRDRQEPISYRVECFGVLVKEGVIEPPGATPQPPAAGGGGDGGDQAPSAG